MDADDEFAGVRREIGTQPVERRQGFARGRRDKLGQAGELELRDLADPNVPDRPGLKRLRLVHLCATPQATGML